MNEIVQNSLTSSRFWYVELILLLLYGAGVGYECQRTADSGQGPVENLFVITAVGFLSFLAGAVVAFTWRKCKPGHLYWVSAPISGAFVFSLLFGVVWFSYNSVGYRGTVNEILAENAGFFIFRVVFLTILFSFPVLLVLALPRVAYIFNPRKILT